MMANYQQVTDASFNVEMQFDLVRSRMYSMHTDNVENVRTNLLVLM